MTRQLEYSMAPKRRWRRMGLVALATVFALTLSLRDRITPYYQQLRYLITEHRAVASFRAPAGTVAVETDGDRAAALIAKDPQNYHTGKWLEVHPVAAPRDWKPYAFYLPPVLKSLGVKHGFSRPGRGVLFAHQRTSPAGNTRIVVITADRWRTDYDQESLEFQAWLFAPADLTPLSRPWKVATHGLGPTIASDPELGVQFFVGEPDPDDPSHFTIPYRAAGTSGTIDGWLTDDAISNDVHKRHGPVKLVVRDGPLEFLEFDAMRQRRNSPPPPKSLRRW